MDCPRNCHSSCATGRRALKLVVPCWQGCIVRSDIISLRMVDCALIRCVSSPSPKLHSTFRGDFRCQAFFHRYPKLFQYLLAVYVCAELIQVIPYKQHWLRLILNSTIDCHLFGSCQWRYQNEHWLVWKELRGRPELTVSTHAIVFCAAYYVNLHRDSVRGTHLLGKTSTSINKSRLIFRQRPISRLMLLWLMHTSGALYMLDMGWILSVPDL